MARISRSRMLCGCILLVGASTDIVVHNGNAWFQQREYAKALACYIRGEVSTLDPGLVAFNKASALYHLARYDEATFAYRCSLQDAKGMRHLRATYGLGTCLVHMAILGNRDCIDEAMERLASAAASTLDSDLASDAHHNLNIAIAWKQSAANDRASETRSGSQDNKSASNANPSASTQRKHSASSGVERVIRYGDKGTAESSTLPIPGIGNLPLVPDTDALLHLNGEDARVHLRLQASRIEEHKKGRRAVWGSTSSRRLDW